MGFFDERREDDSSASRNTSTEDPYSYMRQNRTSSILVFVLIIAAYMIYTFVGNGTSCGGETTTGRVRLNIEDYTLLDSWYDKESDYTSSIVSDAMIDFHSVTGIQPFVLVVDGESKLSIDELTAMAEEYYRNDLFGDQSVDEGHMVIAFQTSDGNIGIYSGTDAATIMDDDAVGKFRTLLSSNYTKYSGTKILEKTFRKAGTEIMGRSKMTIYIIIVLAVICVLYFAFNYAKALKRRQNEQSGNGGTSV